FKNSKYTSFCSISEHLNYRSDVNGWYNRYGPLSNRSSPGSFLHTKMPYLSYHSMSVGWIKEKNWGQITESKPLLIIARHSSSPYDIIAFERLGEAIGTYLLLCLKIKFNFLFGDRI